MKLLILNCKYTQFEMDTHQANQIEHGSSRTMVISPEHLSVTFMGLSLSLKGLFCLFVTCVSFFSLLRDANLSRQKEPSSENGQCELFFNSTPQNRSSHLRGQEGARIWLAKKMLTNWRLKETKNVKWSRSSESCLNTNTVLKKIGKTVKALYYFR